MTNTERTTEAGGRRPGALEHVENLVLGGGEAGKYVAWDLARRGRPVLVVERGLIGGSCPNVACLPSKNLIRSAQVAHLAAHAGEYGGRAASSGVDMNAVRERKRTMVAGMIGIHERRFAAPGIELTMGEGRFTAPRTVEVHPLDGGATRRVVADRVFLNVGTFASVPDLPGMAEAAPLTHVEALELDRLPEHLLVLGGGYVGVELAQAFRRFGSRVTIVQRGAQLLDREDADVAEEVRQLLAEEGVEIVLEAEADAVEGRLGERVSLLVRAPKGEEVLTGTDLLVATGRTPRTAQLGLEHAGVEIDARGYIVVDERLRTTAESVWAMGECAGSPQFTHAAFDDFRVVRDDLAGVERTTTGRLVPYCVFTDPELGRVGLDEKDARRLGVQARVHHLPMKSVLRARAMVETRGFMKALHDPASGRILGFTMLGPSAGEVIAVVQVAMLAGLHYATLRDAILTHPTMAEGLNVLFGTEPRDLA